MESKQLTRKLNSIFWWTLTALPLLIIMGYLISSILNFNTQVGGITDADDTFNFWYAFDIKGILNGDAISFLMDLVPSQFTTAMTSLFNVIGVNNNGFAYIMSWVVSIQMYHLLIDVLLFVVRWCHDLMERGVK